MWCPETNKRCDFAICNTLGTPCQKRLIDSELLSALKGCAAWIEANDSESASNVILFAAQQAISKATGAA